MTAFPEPKTTLRPYAEAFGRLAGERSAVLCLTGDLSNACEVDGFAKSHPDRFVNLGMAEQNLMGVAAGLTREGHSPFVHTFGVFATRRALDQVEMAIALPRAPVRIMGFLPGITTPGGPTHQAIDDVAIARALPNMTVVDLADATDIATGLAEIDDVEGPVYARVLRGDVPILFDSPFALGQIRTLSTGSDLTVISSSVATLEARRAVTVLEGAGVGVLHLHVGTIKPLDTESILAAVAATNATVVLENHLVVGGLGSAVAEVTSEHGLAKRVRRLGIDDRYATAGTLPYLLDELSMDWRAVVDAAGELLGQPIDYDRDAMSSVEVGAGDLNRQEAL